MKIRFFDKLIVVLVALFLGLTAIYVICMAIGVLPTQPVIDTLNWMGLHWLNALAGVAVGLVVFAIAARMIAMLFATGAGAVSQYAKITSTSYGDIIIANDTIRQVVQHSMRIHPEVIKSLITIHSGPEAVAVTIKMAIRLDDVNIPEVTTAVQETVRSAIAQTTGITVNNVRINVDNSLAGNG